MKAAITKRQRQIYLIEHIFTLTAETDSAQIIEQTAQLKVTLKRLKAEEAMEQKVDEQIEQLEALLAARNTNLKGN